MHGKAGVITMANGRKTSFMGSANETKSGWELDYELVWEDDSGDAVKWVQDEFDALWTCHEAFPLAGAVIEDIERLVRRAVIPSTKAWRDSPGPNAASPIIETPVYRKQYGLWAHQKYFVERAFEAHRSPAGARYVLADMVGLGKTVQLAMAGMLMALWGDKPVLVIAPKALLWQWHDEMLTLLDMPSAVWNGRQWVDENQIVYPVLGAKGVQKCPRRVGIVSQGLFTANSEAAEYFLGQQYECIILDEAHHARRKNLGPDKEAEKPEPNNLMRWMIRLAPLTKSMLLATATPVQLYAVGQAAEEAFRTLSPTERSLLETFVQILEASQMTDPKFSVVVRLLKEGHALASQTPWASMGCMIFSQYYDSAEWIASRISAEEFPGKKCAASSPLSFQHFPFFPRSAFI